MTDPHNSGGARAADARFAVLMTAAFVGVVAIGMGAHELWRDEWQAWLLARDSDSMGALFDNIRYEGHPPTWHLLLFGLSRFTRSVVAMQMLHLALAAAAIWTFVRHAPFSRVQKALFTFGYYPAYEYAVISRSYVLGMLALFGACAVWSARRRSYLPLACWLVLLSLTSVFGVILTLAFVGAMVAEWVVDADLRASLRRRTTSTALAFGLIAVAVTLSVTTARPPQDRTFAGRPASRDASSEIEAVRAVGFIPARTFVPLPRFRNGVPIWGETLIVEGPGVPNSPLVGLALGLCIGLFAARRIGAFVLFSTGTTGLLLFALLFHYGHLRHHGHLMLLIAAACWLALLPGADGWPAGQRGRVRDLGIRTGAYAFMLVLAIHAATFAIFYIADLRLPFTEGEEAARVLAAAGAGSSVRVAATNGAYGTTLAGYLDMPIHYMDQGTAGTFMIWGMRRQRVPPDSVLPRAIRLMRPDESRLLLATDRPLPTLTGFPGVRIEPLPGGSRMHLAPELFELYRITRVEPAQPAPPPGDARDATRAGR